MSYGLFFSSYCFKTDIVTSVPKAGLTGTLDFPINFLQYKLGQDLIPNHG